MNKELLRELVNPSKTSLLVIDIQNDYCSPKGKLAQYRKLNMAPVQKMIPKLDRFIVEARRFDVPVIWTQMTEDHRYVPENVRIKMESFGEPLDLCTPNTWGYDFYILKPSPKDDIVPKKHYDAFTNPKLKELLENKGARIVITTGVYTSRCVDSTVRRASAEGYNVVIPKDLVAMARQHKDKHKNSLSELDLLFAYVVKSKDIVNAWKRK
jgi:ureidoacrylate peracid hydrolase